MLKCEEKRLGCTNPLDISNEQEVSLFAKEDLVFWRKYKDNNITYIG
jgi:hypothetical protein